MQLLRALPQLATFLLGGAFAPTAWASSRMHVTTDTCPQLSVAEVERLLTLELEAVAEDADWTQAPSVGIICGFHTVRIVIGDRANERVASREIPAPKPGEPDAERIIALAASELVLAWLPGFVPDAPRPQPLEPTAVPAPIHDDAFSSIAPFGGARVQDWDNPILSARMGLIASIDITKRWLVRVAAAYQIGQASRPPGSVDVHGVFGEVGLMWRPVIQQTFHLDASLNVGGGALFFQPVITDGSFSSEEATRGALSLGGVCGPGWRFNNWDVAIDIELGALLLDPQAVVVGYDPVDLTGFYAGATARVGFAW